MGYVLYPIFLLITCFAVIMWPSPTCRRRYKRSTFMSLARVCCASFFAVDFTDNMIGDILTILAKPLLDVPTAYCYLTSPHPVPEDLVDRFIATGTTCIDQQDTHFLLTIVIVGLPYTFRALQCLRRY